MTFNTNLTNPELITIREIDTRIDGSWTSSGGKAAAADQSKGCKVSASTEEFALRTDSAETFHFDSVGNARAEEAIKNKKNWSADTAAGKPIRAKVSANATGDKLTVMSIN
jgi:hypothetical protein